MRSSWGKTSQARLGLGGYRDRDQRNDSPIPPNAVEFALLILLGPDPNPTRILGGGNIDTEGLPAPLDEGGGGSNTGRRSFMRSERRLCQSMFMHQYLYHALKITKETTHASSKLRIFLLI